MIRRLLPPTGWKENYNFDSPGSPRAQRYTLIQITQIRTYLVTEDNKKYFLNLA